MSKKSDFSSLIGDVNPIKPYEISKDFYPSKTANPIDKRQYAEDFEHAAISQSDYDIGVEDYLHFNKHGIADHLMKKLAKGQIPPDESIDLHGMTTLEAEIYMATTIENQQYATMSCLRIVHGKGYNSSDSPYDKPLPKLKNFTARYLSQHPRVLAFVSCPAARGGTGAVYVLLKKQSSR